MYPFMDMDMDVCMYIFVCCMNMHIQCLQVCGYDNLITYEDKFKKMHK